MSPKFVDRDEKQRAIALASVEVFGSSGFERTRMEDVAKAAGVGKGTIYEYFKNKEELMEGAVGALLADMGQDMMPAVDPDRSVAHILTEVIQETVVAIKNVGFAYRFFLEYMIHTSRSNKSDHFLAEMLTAYRHWLADLISQGVARGEFRDDLDPFDTAAALAAWIDGAVFHWYTLPGTVSLEAMGACFLETTLNGLVNKKQDQ